MTHEAVLSFTYNSSAAARQVTDAIGPEIGAIDDERSQVRHACEGAELTLTLQARDPSALRAAVNTWCSLVSVAESAGAVEESRTD